MRPFICIWPKRTSSFPKQRKLRLMRHLLANQTLRPTVILVRTMPSLGMVAHYNVEAAALAHERTDGFLNRQLR
jgi:hypothetical protein